VYTLLEPAKYLGRPELWQSDLQARVQGKKA
jgi:hypothetical protein